MNAPLHEKAQAEQSASRGWRARLELQFQHSLTHTRLVRRRHVGPLLVQRAFYPERQPQGAHASSNPCHLYIIHPPGGVAGGDELELEASLQPGSHALLTTPAAGKFYRRGDTGAAQVTQAFDIADAALEWLPQENIFYPDAAVELRTIVKLSPAARFIGWEVGCLGLPASGRRLEGGDLRFSFELWQEGRPLWLERLALGRTGLSPRWGLADHAALGTAIFYPAGLRELELARANVPAICTELTVACTLVDGVLVCRALGHRTDRLRQAFVRLWQALRPALLGREAVLPRIWNT